MQAAHESYKRTFVRIYGGYAHEPCNVNHALGPIKGHDTRLAR
jgi:hypothetical protein